MKKVNFYLIVFLCQIIGFSNLFGQTTNYESEQLLLVNLKDGTSIIGNLLQSDEKFLKLSTLNLGEVTIQKNQIKTTKPIDESTIKKGVYWFENPNDSKYLFSPSGYSLEKGEGYYQNFMLFYNGVGYGITDRFTIGAGTIPFTFGEGFIGTIQAKYSFPIIKNKLNAGFGLTFGGSSYEKITMGYGVLTYGSRDHNVSISAGYSIYEGELIERPTITISGVTRLGRKFGLITESWFFPARDYNYDYDAATGKYTRGNKSYYYSALPSLGVRYIGEKISLDLSVGIIDEYAFPLVGVAIPFGK